MGSHKFRYLSLDDQKTRDFREKIEKETFVFSHSLNSSPLMTMPALRELCQYLMEHDGAYHHESGATGVGAGFSTIRQDVTLLDAFDSLNEQTLIFLKSIHIHPEYKKLLDDFLDEFSVARGIKFSSRYTKPICTVILASPRRVTPYHIDNAENLLMQIHGSKQFFVFDGNDRSIVTEEDLELYWGAGAQDVPKYSAEVQTKAIEYNLQPGVGVHVPLTFPHWVQNGDEISVAMSINFQQRKCDQRNVNWANYQLRKLGVNPRAFGDGVALDAWKSAAVQSALAMRSAVKKTD